LGLTAPAVPLPAGEREVPGGAKRRGLGAAGHHPRGVGVAELLEDRRAVRPEGSWNGRGPVARLGPAARRERLGERLVTNGGRCSYGVPLMREGHEQEELSRFVEESRQGGAG